MSHFPTPVHKWYIITHYSRYHYIINFTLFEVVTHTHRHEEQRIWLSEDLCLHVLFVSRFQEGLLCRSSILALAVKYAEELQTHLGHVMESLEELWNYALTSGEYSVRGDSVVCQSQEPWVVYIHIHAGDHIIFPVSCVWLLFPTSLTLWP